MPRQNPLQTIAYSTYIQVILSCMYSYVYVHVVVVAAAAFQGPKNIPIISNFRLVVCGDSVCGADNMTMRASESRKWISTKLCDIFTQLAHKLWRFGDKICKRMCHFFCSSSVVPLADSEVTVQIMYRLCFHAANLKETRLVHCLAKDGHPKAPVFSNRCGVQRQL